MEAGLFGQKHSSRDYTKSKYWGKNQFNSSFPASLVAYMSSKNIQLVYLKTDKHNKVYHDKISGEELFRINPLSDKAFYNYEAGYSEYEKFYSGDREKIDLVMMNRETGENLCGLEVKLTALPDNTTKKFDEDKYSCEIVMRPPTICFLACSICKNYETSKERLRKLISGIPKINHWETAEEVAPHYKAIEKVVLKVASDMCDKQSPLILQPVWKTQKDKMQLADDCLDVFVWSNLAILQMCIKGEENSGTEISRFQRTIIWIYKMLFDFCAYDKFDYVEIIKNHSYGNANDKAFAISGLQTYNFLSSDELTHPRINKNEIKNIILGGGQNMLSPERRFDAVLFYSPEIFKEERFAENEGC